MKTKEEQTEVQHEDLEFECKQGPPNSQLAENTQTRAHHTRCTTMCLTVRPPTCYLYSSYNHTFYNTTCRTCNCYIVAALAPAMHCPMA